MYLGTNWFVEHRGKIACLVGLMTLIAVISLPRLRVDDGFRSLLVGDQSPGGTRVGENQFGPDDNTCVILIEGDRIFTPRGLDAIRRACVDLERVENVLVVYSIFDARRARRVGRYLLPLFPGPTAGPDKIEQARAAAARHPLLAGQFVSADQRTVLALVQLRDDVFRAAEVAGILKELRGTLAKNLAGSGLSAEITGLPAIQVEMYRSIIRDQVVFNAGGMLIGLIVAAILARSSAAVLVVMSGPALGVLWTLGFMALVGEPLNLVNGVITPLVLVIGLTDSVHLMFEFRRERSLGTGRVEAAVSAIRQVGIGCILTSLTTAVAFASLATADMQIIRHFGLCCAAGVLLTFAAVITVNPLLSTTRLGDRLARPRPGDRPLGEARWLDRVASRLIRCRWAVTVAGGVATLCFVLISTSLQPDIRLSQMLPASGSARASLDRCDRLFAGTLPVSVMVEWRRGEQLDAAELLQVVGEVHDVVESEPLLASPISLRSVLQTLPGSGDELASRMPELHYIPQQRLDRILLAKRRRTMVLSRTGDVGSRVSEPMFARIENQLDGVRRRYPGFRICLHGWVVQASSVGNAMARDLVISLYTAVGITFCIVTITFRSFKIGLISLLPNLLPLALTGTAMIILGLPLHFGTATVFSICFGIAVDDTLHFLIRHQQEVKRGVGYREAIKLTARKIGRALISTTVVMLTAVLVLSASEVRLIREFGWVFAFAMIWALLGDLILLPAILACFPDRRTV